MGFGDHAARNYAALLLADFAETLGSHTEAKIMDSFYRACKETVKAADGLFKAMLAPKTRSLPKPGKHVLEAAAALSHELVQSVYCVLLLNKEDDQNEPPGVCLLLDCANLIHKVSLLRLVEDTSEFSACTYMTRRL